MTYTFTGPSLGASLGRSLAASLAVVALCSCQIQTAPDPSAGIGPTARVYTPVLEEEIGGLHLDRDGLWIFLTEDESRTSSYAPGQLVVFGDTDETSRHIFAVIEIQPWGVRMQRLDADPVASDTEGALIPLSRPDLQTGKRWNFCVGDGNPAAADCLDSARPGTRWYVYPLTTEGRADLGDDANRPRRVARPALPVPLAGVVAVGSLGTDPHVPSPPSRWIAIPGEVLARPTVPVIVVDQECRSVIGDPREFDAQWSSAQGPFGTHPVEVTSHAYRAGADAFVTCDGDDITLSTPGLYRRGVELAGQGFSAPPLLASKRVVLRGVTPDVARRAARLAAAVSTGDFVTADLYADGLARAGDNASIDTLLMLAMAAIADGGRPEAALALGLRAGRRDWNIANSAPWIWGVATAERALGVSKEAIVRTQSLSEALDRSGDDEMRGWMAYFWSVEQLRKRESVGDALEMLDSHPLYAFAARAEFAQRRSPEKFDTLRSEFESRDLVPLGNALAGRDVALPCPSGGCALDVYGRRWAGGSRSPEAASRVGVSSFRPGFQVVEGGEDADDPMASLITTLAVFPFLPAMERTEAVETASQASSRWLGEHCFPHDAGADAALERLRRLGIDAALRMEWEAEPLDATMAWLAIRGVPAACVSPAELVERASGLSEVAGASTVPADLLGLWVERGSGEELRAVLTEAAAYVTTHERGQRCVDWNLALAVDAVRAGRFEDARGFVQSTVGCEAQDRFESDLVAAYLGFQRSGHVSSDFDERVQERLAVVVHAAPDPGVACLGAGQLEYHLLPHVSQPIAALVRRLPSLRGDPEESLGIVTAADRLDHAREALGAVVVQLDAGEPVQAARELGFARERFEALGHAVGLARVRWIDEVVFGGRGADVASEEPTIARDARRAVLTVPKKRTFTQHASDPKTDPRVRLAYAAAAGDEPLVRAIVESAESNFSQFCVVPEVVPRGTVLDLGADGRLERVADDPLPDAPQ